MSDKVIAEPKRMTLTAFHAFGAGRDGYATGFAVHLDTPMTAELAWGILVGGMVAFYRNTLSGKISEEEFGKQTSDKLSRMLEETKGQNPLQN
jgi:hypothetical protein